MSDNNQISVKAQDDRMVPVYANHIRVSHSAEEFIIETYSIFPPQGVLIGRTVISPEHAKRLLGALTENIQKYEQSFKKISEAVVPFDPSKVQVGGME